MTTTYLATLADVGAGIPSGTSFPGSPATNDLFRRTDLGMIFYYDGTRWLSQQLFQGQFVAPTVVMPLSASGGAGSLNMAMGVGTDIWIEKIISQLFVASGGTALSGSHKWVGTIAKSATDNTPTTLDTVTRDSGASATWTTTTTAVGALLGTAATYPRLAASWVKTGTPGTLTVIHTATFRIVQT